MTEMLTFLQRLDIKGMKKIQTWEAGESSVFHRAK